MNKYKIKGGWYYSFAPERGHNTDRFNRVAKIAREFKSIEDKLFGMVERGAGVTAHAQMALGLLMTMHTGIRIGNESSAEGYMTKPHPNSKVEPKFVQTYGLTTMKREHVTFNRDGSVHFNFLGKKHVENFFEVPKGDLAYWLSYTIENLEGGEEIFDFSPALLTKFIKRHVGRQFSPKDFRTMRANVLATEKYREVIKQKVTTKKEANELVKAVAIRVSEGLNNTPGVCKKSYIDPRLMIDLIENKLKEIETNKTKK